MEEYKSNSANNRAVENPFRPSFLIVLLYLLFSFIILSALNTRVIWSVLVNSNVGPTAQISLQPLTDNLLNFMGRLNTFFLLAIWGLFGAVVYSLIWVIQNVLSTVENEFEESHYLKGGVAPVTLGGYWQRVMVSNLALVGAAVAWIFYVAIFLIFILPYASKLYYLAFYEPRVYRQILDVIGAMIIGAFSLYLFKLIHFFMASIWRVSRH